MVDFFIALKWPLIALQALISLVLIIMILLQSGKGDDIGSALSGRSGGNVQGTGGTSKFLVRGTAIFAILFMVNSIALAKIFKEISGASIGGSAPQPLVPAAGTATNSVVGNTIVVPSPSVAPSKHPTK
jgi:preprotein translocase subunit SecG